MDGLAVTRQPSLLEIRTAHVLLLLNQVNHLIQFCFITHSKLKTPRYIGVFLVLLIYLPREIYDALISASRFSISVLSRSASIELRSSEDDCESIDWVVSSDSSV